MMIKGNIVNRAKEIKREKGLIGLITRIPPFIKYQVLDPIHQTYLRLFQSILPIKRNAILNDVEVPDTIERPRLYFDEYIPFYTVPDNQIKENGIIKAHKKYTKLKDDIVIIARGMGVSTVRAAREASDGKLEVFEGGSEQAEAVRDVVGLHNLEDQVTVHHGIVGKEIDIYGAGQASSADKIQYDEIPECDVLELDCEGSELEIIRNMEISPRLLIVELHPYKAGEHLTAVLEAIDETGYNIVCRFSNQGEKINHNDLIALLSQRESRNVLPPVVVAEKRN